MRGQRLEQAKRHARRIVSVWRAMHENHADWYAPDNVIERRMRQCRVLCSGPCCGNPRRHFGQPTLQERRADEAMAVELDEISMEMAI